MSNPEVAVQNHSSQYYETRYTGYGLAYHARIIQWLMEGRSQDDVMLDAGCGTGLLTKRYPGYDIRGIDLSPDMIARCPDTELFHVGDVCLMPEMPRGAFDFVLCRSLLHHLPHPEKALAEFSRILKPGGHIAFWETNKSWLASVVRGWTQHGDRFSTYHHSFRETELLDMVRTHFLLIDVAYQGFLCYPLFGFPDILPLQTLIPFKSVIFPLTWTLDEWLGATPCLKHLSFALGIRAIKR